MKYVVVCNGAYLVDATDAASIWTAKIDQAKHFDGMRQAVKLAENTVPPKTRFCVLELSEGRTSSGLDYLHTKVVFDSDDPYSQDVTGRAGPPTPRGVDPLVKAPEPENRVKGVAASTPEEDKVLEMLGNAFMLFDKLPPVHPRDKDEFVLAIHAAQNIVLARIGMRALHDLHARA